MGKVSSSQEGGSIVREQVEGRGKMEVPKYSRKGRRVGKAGGSKVGRSCRPDQDRAELCCTFILHKGPDRKLWQNCAWNLNAP